jgi:hypothetical protein
MRELNEKFEQFQVTAASIISLSDVMKQEVDNLKDVKNNIGVIVATVSSSSHAVLYKARSFLSNICRSE